MGRVVLIHWKAAEAGEKLDLLTRAGHDVRLAVPGSSLDLRGLVRDSEAVVIDLSRLPLQGRDIAIALRGRVESRAVPIVFAGGAPDKIRAIRKVLPDAGYLEWDGMAGGLAEAIRNAPTKPVTPDTMAGYSGTPLPKKLGIREGTAVALVGAPDGFQTKLTPLPEGVKFVSRPSAAARILLFVTSMKEFQKRWAAAAAVAPEGATIWICWPKKTSSLAGDVSETKVRAYGLDNGWVDYKICAVDETWSGLAFARRKAAKGAAHH